MRCYQHALELQESFSNRSGIAILLNDIGAGLTQPFTVTGITTGGIATISPANALPDRLLISYIHVSAANTVEVKFFNATAAAIDLVSMDWSIVVVE